MYLACLVGLIKIGIIDLQERDLIIFYIFMWAPLCKSEILQLLNNAVEDSWLTHIVPKQKTFTLL